MTSSGMDFSSFKKGSYHDMCNIPWATGEGEYSLKYGEVGTRVAIVSSEPITGSSDWVSVPRNTALVISQGKSGYVSILKSPLSGSGKHARQEEVMRCLEAVTSAAEVEGQAYPLHRHKRRRMTQSVGEGFFPFLLPSLCNGICRGAACNCLTICWRTVSAGL